MTRKLYPNDLRRIADVIGVLPDFITPRGIMTLESEGTYLRISIDYTMTPGASIDEVRSIPDMLSETELVSDADIDLMIPTDDPIHGEIDITVNVDPPEVSDA